MLAATLAAPPAVWAWPWGDTQVAPRESRIKSWRLAAAPAPDRGEKAAGVRLADMRLELPADHVEGPDGAVWPRPASLGQLLLECPARWEGRDARSSQRWFLDRPAGVARAACGPGTSPSPACLAGERFVLLAGTETQIFETRVRWLFRGEPHAPADDAAAATVRLGGRPMDVNRARAQMDALHRALRETVLLAEQKAEPLYLTVFALREPTREQLAAEARRVGSEWKVNVDRLTLSLSVNAEPLVAHRFAVDGAARAMDELDRRCDEVKTLNQERLAKVEQHERVRHRQAAIQANLDREREHRDLVRRGCRPIGATIVCPP